MFMICDTGAMRQFGNNELRKLTVRNLHDLRKCIRNLLEDILRTVATMAHMSQAVTC